MLKLRTYNYTKYIQGKNILSAIVLDGLALLSLSVVDDAAPLELGPGGGDESSMCSYTSRSTSAHAQQASRTVYIIAPIFPIFLPGRLGAGLPGSHIRKF